MATLPRFIFPSTKESQVLGTTRITKKEKPQIQLDTNSASREESWPAASSRLLSRPAFLRTITPPDSPTRTRSRTMATPPSPKMHDSSIITPPSTPIHAKSGSACSDFLTSLSGLRRGDSPSSLSGRPSLDDSARPGSTELLTFPHHLSDYQIQVDSEGRKRPIGVGAWSDVYLATPSLPHSIGLSSAAAMSQPLTPVHSRGSSKGSASLPSLPPLYAIKVPGSTSAKKVLSAEARILSYLSRFPDVDQHVVPFYGQDTRTGALVLKAMDGTLEDWIEKDLNALDATSRAQKLAAIFPGIALSLIDSLIWMQHKDCIHADIKPSNILVSSSSATAPDLVFSDFSSTILTTSSDDATPPPLGAGTWEFLDPSLLSFSYPATPCAATDLYSLAISLLFLILGTSPYEHFKHNKFQQREMIKSGDPLRLLRCDNTGMNVKILNALSQDLGFDVTNWLRKVLVKEKEKRVDVEAWREDLVGAMSKFLARI
eukprot:GHVO01037516.1.p1 GENE.GHVO01037516.1~~GHVO01037516.1.p1  ORF type:complete len:486 (-),score=19.71 GHVO01037516.1:57-1514(-)